MREEHRLINHIMGCPDCKPRGQGLCAPGQELRFEYVAGFIASQPRLIDRQRWISVMREHMPAMIDRLEQRVRELYDGLRK